VSLDTLLTYQIEEVTEWANNTTYGLAASILTQDVSRAIRMAHNLEAGSVFVSLSSYSSFVRVGTSLLIG